MPNKSRIAYKIKRLQQMLIGTRYVHIGKNTNGLGHDIIVKNTNAKDPDFSKIMPYVNR